MTYYRHKPTGWIYYRVGCELVSEHNGTIPASIAMFGKQQDWEEIIVEFIVNEKGELKEKKDPIRSRG